LVIHALPAPNIVFSSFLLTLVLTAALVAITTRPTLVSLI